jgi:hypothetical protein
MKRLLWFALGVLLGGALIWFVRRPTTAADHWRVVERYFAYINNPQNYAAGPNGLAETSPPAGLDSSLAALVSMGELELIDIVLPTVRSTRESNRYWMAFCSKHPEIVNMQGNTQYVDFQPTGDPPLHLNIWVRRRDEAVVWTLLRELEERFGTKP